MSSLTSVRRFAASVIQRLGDTDIDALVLNAGTLNGRASILFDTRAHGEFGTFEGAGVITGDAADNAYDLCSLTSLSPQPGVFTGRWHGGSVVFDGYEYVADRRFASRHSITDISADAFTYTIEMGSASGDLAQSATIRYTRAIARLPTPPT